MAAHRGRQDAEVEHRLCSALLRVDEVEHAVGHASRERAQRLITRNQLDLHRPGRVRRIADDDGFGDGATREIPHPDAAADVRGPAIALVIMERLQRADEIAGDHEVVCLVDRETMRIEAVRRRCKRPCLHEPRLGVVLDDAPGLRAAGATHERHEKAAVAERAELVGDGGRRIVRADERRIARIGDIEEEHLVLPTQHTQQAAERHRPPVAGETDVVRFVADRAFAGQWDGTQDLAVGRRIASKSMTAMKSALTCSLSDAQTSNVSSPFASNACVAPASKPVAITPYVARRRKVRTRGHVVAVIDSLSPRDWGCR